VTRVWQRYMGPDSPYRGLVVVVLTLLLLVNMKAHLTRVMRQKLKEHAFIDENASNFLKVWNVLWKFVIAILVIMAMAGSLKLLEAFLGVGPIGGATPRTACRHSFRLWPRARR